MLTIQPNVAIEQKKAGLKLGDKFWEMFLPQIRTRDTRAVNMPLGWLLLRSTRRAVRAIFMNISHGHLPWMKIALRESPGCKNNTNYRLMTRRLERLSLAATA